MVMYGNWMKLPMETRIRIAAQFGIAKVGSTHISDNRIVDDGYKVHDIEAKLSIEAMQNYTQSVSSDPLILWYLMLDKIEGKVTESTPEPEMATVVEVPAVPVDPPKAIRIEKLVLRKPVTKKKK